MLLLLSAPSHPSGTVAFSSRISLPFTVARAVAALHRSSRSPLAHRGYQKGKLPRAQRLSQSSLSNGLNFNRLIQFTKRELTEWVEAVNWTAKKTNALDLLCRRSRAS